MHSTECIPKHKKKLQIQINKLTNAGIVKLLISKFVAPSFLTKKKKEQGSYRWVVSYKELNDLVECDQYPVPRTSDPLRALEGSQYYMSLDLNSEFFQIPVKEEDQYKLGFTFFLGLMTFTRFPKGFKNSSAIFQRALNKLFLPLLCKLLVIYIDDLASYGRDFYQTLKNLRETFEIINNLRFSLKTIFNVKEISYI